MADPTIALAVTLALVLVLVAFGALYVATGAVELARGADRRASRAEKRLKELEDARLPERVRALEGFATTAPVALERPRRDATPPGPIAPPAAPPVPSVVEPASERSRTRAYASPGRAATGAQGAPW